LKFLTLPKSQYLGAPLRHSPCTYGPPAACVTDERGPLATELLVACAPSKQTPPFLTLDTETGILHFKEPETHLIDLKTSATVCNAMHSRPPLFWPTTRPLNKFGKYNPPYLRKCIRIPPYTLSTCTMYCTITLSGCSSCKLKPCMLQLKMQESLFFLISNKLLKISHLVIQYVPKQFVHEPGLKPRKVLIQFKGMTRGMGGGGVLRCFLFCVSIQTLNPSPSPLANTGRTTTCLSFLRHSFL
jgi:hypothetical protein